MKLDPAEQRANRLFLAQRDMNDVLQYLQVLDSLMALARDRRPPHFVATVEGMWVAAIVAYGRPFTTSRSLGWADSLVHTQDIFKSRDGLEELHKVVLTRRNKAAAHSDWAHHWTRLATEPSGPLRISSRPDYAKDIPLDQFRALATHVQAYLKRNGNALDNLVFAAAALPNYSFSIPPGASNIQPDHGWNPRQLVIKSPTESQKY